MYLNDALNLVVPVRTDDDGNLLVCAYHTPISRETFEANYRILAASKAALSAKGVIYQMEAGPRIACMVLKDEGKRDARERNDIDDEGNPKDGGASALLTEFKRLTMIVAPGSEPLPVDAAIAQHVLDAEEWQDTLSAITFFTCHYVLARKSERRRIVDAVASLLSASITALPLTEYASSLQDSTQGAVSPKSTSSVPS